MTPEQRRRLDRLLDIDYSLSEVYSMIDSLVAAEVEKEREACAKIGDDRYDTMRRQFERDDVEHYAQDEVENYASAIRTRSKS